MRHSFRRAMRARWTSLVGCEYATPQTSFGKSMNQRPAEIDDPIADIESPARSVDLDTLNRKIANMAKCTSSTAACVRAHAKTCAGMRDWRACGRSHGHRCWPEVLQQRARLALVHAFKRVKLIASADGPGKLLRSDATRLRPGRKLWLIPAHCGQTANPRQCYVDVRWSRPPTLPSTARAAST